MQGESEIYFSCPFCGEQVSFLVELYHGKQEYVEDCEVCCAPILIKYSTDGETVEIINVERNQ